MPPWPRILRMRNLPSRPSSSSACGGARKSVRLESCSASGLTPIVASGLSEGGCVGAAPASGCDGAFADNSRFGAGGTMRSFRPAPAATLAGTTVSWPHPGHLTFLPAESSWTESIFWHAEHEMVIMRFPCTECADVLGRDLSFFTRSATTGADENASLWLSRLSMPAKSSLAASKAASFLSHARHSCTCCSMASASGSETPPRKRPFRSAGGGQVEMDMMHLVRERSFGRHRWRSLAQCCT